MLKWKLFLIQINNNDFTHFYNMNQYEEHFHENRLPVIQGKFEHFVDIDKFRIVFLFIKYVFQFHVNNHEWTQERLNLLQLKF